MGKLKKAEPSNADVMRAASKILLTASPRRYERGTRGVPRHINKIMYSLCVHPADVKAKQEEAIRAGFKNVRFTPDGKCRVDDRREQHEYRYFRTQDVMLDGGYYETMKESRMRELDRLAGRS